MLAKLQQLRREENAVSPVIGVILMVAVTVVLAAVIGAFVFGLGDSLSDPAPNAQIDFDYTSSNGNLIISHDGGDTITSDNTGELSISGDYTPVEVGAENDPDIEWLTGDGDDHTTSTTIDERVSSGDEIVYIGLDDTEDHDVSLVWESPDGGTSSTLGSFETRQ